MQVRSNSSPGSSRVGRQAGPSFGKGVQIKFKLVKTVGSSFIQSFFFDLTWNKFVPSCKSKQGWGSELQSLFFCCWAQNKVDSCDGNLKASRHDASGFGYSVESPSQAPSLSCACCPCFEEAVGLSSWNHRWIRSRRPSGKRDWWWCQFATCFNKFQANCFLQALPIDFFLSAMQITADFQRLNVAFFSWEATVSDARELCRPRACAWVYSSSKKKIKLIWIQTTRNQSIFNQFFVNSRRCAPTLLKRCAQIFGEDYVKTKICPLSASSNSWIAKFRMPCLNHMCPCPSSPFLPGTCTWKMFDLFGGALCLRQAWAMILRAAYNLWGVRSQTTWGFNAPQINFSSDNHIQT